MYCQKPTDMLFYRVFIDAVRHFFLKNAHIDYRCDCKVKVFHNMLEYFAQLGSSPVQNCYSNSYLYP